MISVNQPDGIVTPTLLKAPPMRELSVDELKHYGFPHKSLPKNVSGWREENHKNFLRGFEKVRIAIEHGIPHFYGRLWIKHFKTNGEVVDYGLVSLRVVTTAGVNFIVDAFQNLTEVESMKYHGIGTSNTAEAVGNTALATELTTQYNPDNTRATGSLTEGASANIFRTVGTNTVDASVTIVEHGIFSQAATGGGTLLDRSIFAGIAMGTGDSLQTTYDLTFAAGS